MTKQDPAEGAKKEAKGIRCSELRSVVTSCVTTTQKDKHDV